MDNLDELSYREICERITALCARRQQLDMARAKESKMRMIETFQNLHLSEKTCLCLFAKELESEPPALMKTINIVNIDKELLLVTYISMAYGFQDYSYRASSSIKTVKFDSFMELLKTFNVYAINRDTIDELNQRAFTLSVDKDNIRELEESISNTALRKIDS